MTEDPRRIVDGGTDDLPGADAGDLRALIGAARSDLPDPARLAAVFARLPPSPGPGGGGPGAGVAAGATSLKAPWILAALVGAGAIGGGALWLRAPSASTSNPSPSGTPSSMASAPSASLPASAPVLVEPAPSSPSPPPSASPVPPRAPLVAPSADASSAPPRPEIEILSEAQAATGNNPARVLSLVAEHERGWPRGALGQERDMLRIQALASLGRTTEAKQRAEAFRTRYPKSAYLQRLDAMFP